MPIREYLCESCNNTQEELILKPEHEPVQCNMCLNPKLKLLPSAIGGYQGDLGSASTRPKSAGFRRHKPV